jgi:hypothetical protein
MNKQYLIFICIALMLASLFTAPVLAAKPAVTHDDTLKYTRYVGMLGRAQYEILMPDNWNGHLVIGCKGFTPTTTNPIPTMESMNTHVIGLQFMTESKLVTEGGRFAYAQSTYGVIGFCMQEGMIRTHQLTQYIIDNFQVTGKVFLIGISMGGQIALMLEHKYPGLYAGVLDIVGNKDTTSFYNYWKGLATLPANASAVRTYLNGPPTYLSTLATNAMNDTVCLKMRISAVQVMLDVEAECGGTPESKPQSYDRISPTCHPELTVPVISMVARADMLVPIQHFNDYYDAVNASGCLNYYRCYKFITTHASPTMIAAVPTYFDTLFDWAMGGSAPSATLKPYP